MTRYIFSRLTQLVISLIVVSLITFLLMHAAPGDFLTIEAQSGASQGAKIAGFSTSAYWQSKFAPSIPVWKQYLLWLRDALFFDFGPSFSYPTTLIQDMVGRTFPISLQLATLSTVVAILIGIPLGVLAAVRRNTWVDSVATTLALLGRALPPYLAAVFLILVLSVQMKLVPALGWGQPKHYVLPVLALALIPISTIARYVRTSLIEQLEQDYVRTAWAKGGSMRQVVFGHALRNSMIPVITIIGPQIGGLMVGSIFIEQMLGIPGMGRLFGPAASSRDYPLIMASTVFFAGVIMGMNLVVDILYFFLNPRLRTAK